MAQTGQVHHDIVREGDAQQGWVIGGQVFTFGQHQALQRRGARRCVDEAPQIIRIRRRQGLLEQASLLVAAAGLQAQQDRQGQQGRNRHRQHAFSF
ncbi:hypothetical protein D3C85_1453970 [compost metagenome]